MFDKKKLLSSICSDFNGFRLGISRLDDDVTVVDWREPGTSIDSIQFVMVDKTLFIDGDLGSAVVNFKEPVKMKNLATLVDRESYFVEKLSCSSALYTYDRDDTFKELDKLLYEICEVVMADEKSTEGHKNQVLAEWKDVIDDLKEKFSDRDGVYHMGTVNEIEKLMEFDEEICERLQRAGRHLHRRVYAWLLALNIIGTQFWEDENR